jgi:hypothetical protein
MDCFRLRGCHPGWPVPSCPLASSRHIRGALDANPQHLQPFEALARSLLSNRAVEEDVVNDHSGTFSCHRGDSSRPCGLQRTPLVTEDHFPLWSVGEQRRRRGIDEVIYAQE